MSTKIDTVLFDLDGTLINTNELIISSFLYTLDHYYPRKYKRNDVLPFIGPPLIDTFKSIDQERFGEMVTMYRAHNTEHHDELVTEFEGVYSTIETLKQEGFKLAIVTTKMRPTVNQGLKLSKLDQLFDVVVTYDDVTHAKPHPEPLLKALDALRSSPEHAMMVGDSQHDICAGKNTGTKTVGVAWSIKGKDYIVKQNPDYVIDHMSELLPILGVTR